MDETSEQIRRLAYKLWQVRSAYGCHTSEEQDWIDAEKMVSTMSWEQINQYIDDLPCTLASEEYPEDPDFESTMPDCPIGHISHRP